ncbi:MAG: AsmA-like C-terminal region-containing protein [Maribacter sp.]|uniref:AsmA-like C-terminal region-containing protein n=1 Tax=Maribacter sp. TaxID=1897614 RepID=UPI003C739648
MKKKLLKIVAVVLLVIVGILIAVPFILEAKIGDILKNNVNNNVNATMDFSEAKLSLIRSFPNAEVDLKGVSLINKAPFAGDTLFAANSVVLKMGIGELFKSSGEAIAIKSLIVDGALLNVKINAEGNASYDIGKSTEGETSNEVSSEGFTLDLQSYEINSSKVIFDDLEGGITLVVDEIQHKGTGDLSLSKSEFETTTEALVSFTMDSTTYLNKNKVKLDALIGVDLQEDKYTFLKNEAMVNQLPLVFEGFVKLNDNDQEVDITFKTPSSDFKNFLAVIPEEYSKNIENVKTSGNFTVEGKFNGIVDDTHIPKFDIKINSENASFKYPDLPKSVSNVHMDVEIENTTGITEDTYVDIRKASFMIDQDKFNMVAKITELMGNTKVKAHLDGRMDLANISKAYPVPADLNLKGLLNADITTDFDMASIEKKQYENTKTSGTMDLKGFEYNSSEIPNPVKLSTTSLMFNPKTVTLNKMQGKTGKTDFDITGTINNLLGFMFNNEKVEGNFNLKSNTFALNDFMVQEPVAASKDEATSAPVTTTEDKIKIPSFLDVNIEASANTVLYDNLVLKDVKGNLRIRDEKATLSNMTSSMFNGKVAFDGEVSTKNETPTFAMKLGLDQLQISETFKNLELFQVLAPVASALQGKLNSTISISGNLTDDFTPNLSTISGNVLAELLEAVNIPDKAKIISAMTTKLDFLKLDKVDLKGLKTALSFENGVVKVKPFSIKYQDMAVNITGSHTFDKKMNYAATLEVPSKYLGKEVNALIAKIDDKTLENLTIPVTANIGGMYDSPTVTTDFTSGVKSLTTKLIEIEKQKLINKGTEKAKDLIGGILNGNANQNDSTKKADPVKDGAKEILGGILTGTQKAKDSVGQKKDTLTSPIKDPVKEATKNILGGLLGGKKKKDTAKTKTDSIN